MHQRPLTTDKENCILNTSLNKSSGFRSIAELFDAKVPKPSLTTAKKSAKKPIDTPGSGKILKNLECEEKQITQKVTIKDLCPEEKQKIGDLMQKLAQEKKEKTELMQKFEKEKKELRDSISLLTKNHQSLLRESQDLKEKLHTSFIALQESKCNSTQEILKEETNLNLTEKVEPEEELGRQTLKEISHLKKEILGLSTVLKSLSFTPEKEKEPELVEEQEETPKKIKEKIETFQKIEKEPTANDLSSLDLDELLKVRAKLLSNVEMANSLVELKLHPHIEDMQRSFPEEKEIVSPEKETVEESEVFRKKLEIVDEIKERMHKNQGTGKEICKAKMAKMLQNVSKNSTAARAKIKEQIQELRSRHVQQVDSYGTVSTNYVSCNQAVSEKKSSFILEQPKLMAPQKDIESDDSEDMQVIKALNEGDDEVPYDDSLFNIIDEIEASETKPQRMIDNAKVSPFKTNLYQTASRSNTKTKDNNPYDSKVYYPRVQIHTLHGYKY